MDNCAGIYPIALNMRDMHPELLIPLFLVL